MATYFNKIMYKRLVNYLDKYDIISYRQFGFRDKHSTSDIFLEFLDEAYMSANSNNYFISIFLDFSKAFDTVNHNILLQKMSNIGIRGIINDWFSSYLLNRKQYISIESSSSDFTNMNIGIPQGSVAGPILFLIYINDMSSICKSMKCMHFADDTTASMSGPNIDNLVVEVNDELALVDRWLIANRLSLNVGKSKFMIFCNKKIPEVININIRGIPLKHVDQFELLGLIIDNRLSFVPHVNFMSSRLSRSIGIMYRSSPYVSVTALRNMYFALIYSRLSYCITAWGGANVTALRRLERVQRRAVKLISNSNHSCCHFHNCRLMSIFDIYSYFVLCKFFRVHVMGEHIYFQERKESFQVDHLHKTRFKEFGNLNPPLFVKSSGQKSFIYNAVDRWNMLDPDIRNSTSLEIFKNNLRNYYFSQKCR